MKAVVEHFDKKLAFKIASSGSAHVSHTACRSSVLAPHRVLPSTTGEIAECRAKSRPQDCRVENSLLAQKSKTGAAVPYVQEDKYGVFNLIYSLSIISVSLSGVEFISENK